MKELFEALLRNDTFQGSNSIKTFLFEDFWDKIIYRFQGFWGNKRFKFGMQLQIIWNLWIEEIEVVLDNPLGILETRPIRPQ